MTAIAEDEPLSLDELRAYQRDGRAWVWAEGDEPPVAYLIADWVDGDAHIAQVSVHPDAAGRRLGRALIEHVAHWAGERGAAAVTLTTFTEVPWNGPYYAKLGFRTVPEAELTEGLRRIRAAEAAHGLDRWPRAVMRRDLPR
jgi:GNAT superfamily N-acetyltransferase